MTFPRKGAHDAGDLSRAAAQPSMTAALRPITAAVLLALGCGAAMSAQPAVRAGPGESVAAAARERALVMQRFIVSATRTAKNPWRYASLPGFEVLSRAPDEETNWEIDALRRGVMFQDLVIPGEWYPRPPVPYTVIIDDTDPKDVPTGELHSRPIEFRSPADALTWGELADKASVSSDLAEAFDADTFAMNVNVHGVSTENPACTSSGVKRLLDCAPPLPGWLIAGLIGPDSGILREGFALVARREEGLLSSGRGAVVRTRGLFGDQDTGDQDRLALIQRTQRAAGPGTLWVSLDETQRLLGQLRKDRRTRILIPPLGELFGEAPLSDEGRALLGSEAALFVRWSLMGPGHEDPVLSRAFLEFARRARREPVTEQVFSECFGFGYAAMEERLEKYLKAVLAKPTSVELFMPSRFPGPEMEAATAEQIGRILGDWLRMQGNAQRRDPELRAKFLSAAGRILERAYRDENGLPVGAEPPHGGERTATPAGNAAPGPAVVLEPLVITADRIHDPRLLAVYGLYEHDIGDDGKARELLEAAVKTGVVRPKAYLVLAELRHSEAISRPLGSKGKLSAAQAASILGLLQTALRYSPTSEVCGRILEVWDHSEAKPADSDIKGFDEDLSLFPRDVDLVYNSALVCAKSGYAARATQLVDRGLTFATREGDRDKLEQLRARLLSISLVPSPGGK